MRRDVLPIVLVLAAIAATPLPADEPAAATKPPSPAGGAAPSAMSSEEKAMFEAWQGSMTPGPQHAVLEPMTGTWTAAMKTWMKPGEPPQESSGRAEFRFILGGRWLEQSFTGTFMGMPFEGRGYTGYDNVRQRYVQSWMDVTTTGMLFMEGAADEGGKVVTTRGDMTDPLGSTSGVRAVTRIEGPDKHVFELWTSDPTQPSETKMMEITYTRIPEGK